MSILDRFLRKTKSNNTVNRVDSYYKFLTPYQPTFTSWDGAIYESDVVRSAVDATARHVSKLQVEIQTGKQSKLLTYLRHQPNELQTWSQFLYRVSTILDLHNTCIIVPLFDDNSEVCGYYPILPNTAKIVSGPDVRNDNGVWVSNSSKEVAWLTYRTKLNVVESVPVSMCAMLTRFNHDSDYFGNSNSALNSVMELINIQNQGIENAVKNSAAYRFWAQVNNFTKSDDLAKEKQRYNAENFAADAEAGGLLLFPNTYSNITQITASNYTADSATMAMVHTNVYNYFGVNEKVLQNSAIGDELDAFFNGKIEPLAIQLSDVLTKVLFTNLERSNGSRVVVTANRLQYMAVATKISMAQQLLDRGVMSINEARELFNYAPINNDIRTIRGEYKNADDVSTLSDSGGGE